MPRPMLPYTRLTLTKTGAGQLVTTAFANYGLRIEGAATNVFTNPTYRAATTSWVSSGGTATRGTTVVPTGFPASVNLVPGGSDQTWTMTLTVTAVTHWLSFLVKRSDAAAVTAADVVGVGQAGAVTLTFISMAATYGTGWYLAFGSYTGVAASSTHGVTAKAGANVYVAAFQSEITHRTSYLDGAMGSGYAWTGTANASTSTRSACSLSLPAASANGLMTPTAFGVAFWITPTMSRLAGQANQRIWTWSIDGDNEITLDYSHAAQTFILTRTGSGLDTPLSSSSYTTVLGTPVFVVAGGSASTLYLSVNGAARSSTAAADIPVLTTVGQYLGSVDGATQHANAVFAEAIFATAAISDADAATLYALTRPVALGEVLGRTMSGRWVPTKPYIEYGTLHRAVA